MLRQRCKVEEILEARKIDHKCVLAPCFGLAYLRSNVIQIYENDNKKAPVSLVIDSDKKIKFVNGMKKINNGLIA